MSPRITRASAARLAASESKEDLPTAIEARPARRRPGSDPIAPSQDLASSRKRKVEQTSPSATSKAASKRSKRTKVDSTSNEAHSLPVKQPDRTVAMSSGNPTSGESTETSPHASAREPLSKKKTQSRKSKDDQAAMSSSRRSKRGSRKDNDTLMLDTEGKPPEDAAEAPVDARPAAAGADPVEESLRRITEDLIDRGGAGDPFSGGYLGRLMGQSGLAGLSGHLRALSGMASGTGNRLRAMLEQLKAKDDPSVQLIALQELSEFLLVSTEDNLAGHFAPDQFVKELVSLMQPHEITGEENPEMMLLACRCIANMMEALPASTASVVYGGAVPVLCQKLLEIHFIDLAEQALSTLEKISVDFPSSIVREGGLTACLTYLDFFPTSTQRTAVTTAANCCRNISEESFGTVRDVMPILQNTLSSSDQRVVEQASLCVSRIVDSFKYSGSKLEELISPDLLKAILRLLLPGSTNMISSNTHTSFLRLLSITARASPQLSTDLLKMDLVGTLYQILTGVSPPSISEKNPASKIDKNVIMQAIIRTPRDQVFETLNVICEILPSATPEDLSFSEELATVLHRRASRAAVSETTAAEQNQKRIKLFEDCKEEVRTFTVILFPTLVHAYSSTVNFHVRQKVLTAQLKMLSNLDVEILQEALRGVAYASHIASILSQQDNPALITFALQATELLLKRIGSIYLPQLIREGVFAEIERLAGRPTKADEESLLKPQPEQTDDSVLPVVDDMDVDMPDASAAEVILPAEETHEEGSVDENEEAEEEHHDEIMEDDDDDDDDDDEHEDRGSSQRSDSIHVHALPDAQDVITIRARHFMSLHGEDAQTDTTAKSKVGELQALSEQLRKQYSRTQDAQDLSAIKRLAGYFTDDTLESITSYELMTSGIVEGLFEMLNAPDKRQRDRAQQDFVSVFMADSHTGEAGVGGATPFAILLHKLQELLSRAEQYEVVTVHHNAFESNRAGAASMLAKQLRLQLVADDDSGIPKPYRRIMVSIHAIATFKALDDYLRPRMSMDKPRHHRHHDRSGELSAYLSAMRDGNPLAQPPTLPDDASPSANKQTFPTDEKTSKSEVKKDDIRRRRSLRKQAFQTPEKPAAKPISETAADLPADQQLECADETHYTEQEDDGTDADFEAEIDALVEDLEEEVIQDTDPSAVNMEVGQTGKVTARTDDGARVSTPSQQGTPVSAIDQDRLSRAHAHLAGLRDALGTPTGGSASRGMSYASALQSVPKDWHLRFSINGQALSNDTTIYRACHFNQAQNEAVSHRGVWSSTHKIHYKRVDGPPESNERLPGSMTNSKDTTTDVSASEALSAHPITATILRLMGILHDLNLHLNEITAEATGQRFKEESPTQFVNAKLTAKLNRQLEEPLIVASNCLPTWSEDLTRLYPFLFPFETRHLYLSSTSFGYSRSMTRWQNAQPEENRHGRHHRDERPFLGRLQRQKVRLSRQRLLESSVKVMDMYGSSPSILEVEYYEEVGTGLGPTLEFYANVSREFSRKKTKLWRENDSLNKGDYATGKQGLFPAPMTEDSSKSDTGQRVLHLFRVLGKFIARSMLDSRIIDVSFNPAFFRLGRKDQNMTLQAVAAIDTELARSLKMLRVFSDARKQIVDDNSLNPEDKAVRVAAIEVKGAKLEDLALDFTLPGYSHMELIAGGAQQAVTTDNVDQYIDLVVELTLGSGVRRQYDAFRAGFSQVFPFDALQAFTPAELVMLFGRSQEDWSLETLMDSVKADHGYNLDSKNVKNLLQTMSEFTTEERRAFLQFVTGSPKLPIGGFKALTPMFTVVRKPAEAPLTSDDYLPSVMTCVNYLKMPDYSTPKVLKEKLRTAVKEGQGSFHLS